MESQMETVKKRVGYNVHRKVMDECEVDEIAEKSNIQTSLTEKLKESVR